MRDDASAWLADVAEPSTTPGFCRDSKGFQSVRFAKPPTQHRGLASRRS